MSECVTGFVFLHCETQKSKKPGTLLSFFLISFRSFSFFFYHYIHFSFFTSKVQRRRKRHPSPDLVPGGLGKGSKSRVAHDVRRGRQLPQELVDAAEAPHERPLERRPAPASSAPRSASSASASSAAPAAELEGVDEPQAARPGEDGLCGLGRQQLRRGVVRRQS